LELCTPFFYKVKQLSKAKIIAVDHNPRPLDGYPFEKRIKKRMKGLLFGRYIDVFIGVSEYTVNELLKDFGKQIKSKSQVVYNGINTLEIEERTKGVRNTFGCFSVQAIKDSINSNSFISWSIKEIK
jgi:hypothetical protein